MAGKDGRRRSTGAAIAGFVLTLLISAQRGEHGNAGDHEAVSRTGVETVAIEFFGAFRNVAKFIALVAIIEMSRDGDR